MACSAEHMLNDYRLVLVGKTGVGKSKAGNALLGKGNYFYYGCDQESVTQQCKYGCNTRFGVKIEIVDTPGVFDTKISNERTQDEIRRCIGMTAPGPHAILMCVKMGRFDQTDCQTLEHFLRYFGQELFKFVIVVFTHFDQWQYDNEEKEMPQTKEEYVKNLNPQLIKFFEGCNFRYVFINNRLKGAENEKQVRVILKMVYEMLVNNKYKCYTNETYEEVNAILEREKRDNPRKTEDEIRQSESYLSKVFRFLVKLTMKPIELVQGFTS